MWTATRVLTSRELKASSAHRCGGLTSLGTLPPCDHRVVPWRRWTEDASCYVKQYEEHVIGGVVLIIALTVAPTSRSPNASVPLREPSGSCHASCFRS